MKTNKFLLLPALLAILLPASFSLASCSDDEPRYDNYMYLSGTVWEGDLYSAKQYDGQTYFSISSVIGFYSDNDNYDTNGYGYWIDYYNEDAWGRDYWANHIWWESDRYGDVAVYFEEDDYTVYLREAVMYDSGFLTGYIEDGDFYEDFELKVTYARNWDAYEYGE